MESEAAKISRLQNRISELHTRNAALRFECEQLKRNSMYSEENERLAEAAYTRFRAQHDASLPDWTIFPNKHIWRDLVQTFQANPRSHVSIANAMEQAVSDVVKAGELPTTTIASAWDASEAPKGELSVSSSVPAPKPKAKKK